MDWFLYDKGLRHERVKSLNILTKWSRGALREGCCEKFREIHRKWSHFFQVKLPSIFLKSTPLLRIL